MNWPRVSALALLILTSIGIGGYLAAPVTVVAGNVHDFFIPLTAGYVADQEGLGHPGLHSPFGVVYFLLSSNSFALISHYPQWLGLDKIQMISSLQWMVAITALFLAFRHLQPVTRRFPLWLLALLLLLCVQGKNFDSLVPLTDWYGTYNMHMWALLMLQAANHYAWRGQGPTGRAVAWLAVLEAAVLLLQFNYKVSFFVAGCGMSLLPLWYLGSWRARAVYYLTLAGTAAAATAVLAGLGVPYASYLRDLAVVAKAKAVKGLSLALQLFMGLAFVTVCSRLDSGAALGQANPLSLTRRLRLLAFHGVAALAIAAGAMGDYFTPVWPYLVLALWAACVGSPGADRSIERRYVGAAGAVLVACLALSAVASLLLLASEAVSRKVDGAIGSEFMAYAPRPLGFRVFSPVSGFAEVAESGLLAPPADPAQALFDYSYRGAGRDRPRLGAMLAAMSGTDYIRDVNATTAWIAARQGALQGSLVIGHVGFANAWPLLTGNRLPPGASHWVHLKTTITPGQLDLVLDPLAAADVTVVPLLSVSGPDQTILNCAFYAWNAARGNPFVPQHLAGHNLIFLRRDGRLPPTAPEPVRQDPADIRQHCERVLADALAGLE